MNLPALSAQQQAERPGRKARGEEALGVMERHLSDRDFFVGGRYGLADIALYGYTHVADRCDFDLATFPSIRAWLKRVEQTPGFVSMDWRPGTEAEPPARLVAGV